MQAKDEWVEVSEVGVISDRDANIGEKLSAIVLCGETGELLEEIPYITSLDEEKGQYVWPKYFSDEINKVSQYIRAGEKNSLGGFDTLNSSYRNKLWGGVDADLEVFSTSHHLDNWVEDSGIISSSSGLPPGTSIKVTIKNSKKELVYENLEFLVLSEASGKFAWPYHLCCFLNSQSHYVRGGEKDELGKNITPLFSSYKNKIWHPIGAPLIVEMSFIAAADLRNDSSESFDKILSSVIKAPVEQSVIEKWLEGFSEGQFKDINYPAQDAGSNVAPLYEHLSRASKILNFARQDSYAYKKYYVSATEAIIFYTDTDFKTKNWWDRQVGLAKAVVECLVLLCENSPASGLVKSVEMLKSVTNVNMGETGANQADFAYVQLLWAVAGWKISSDDLYILDMYAASETMSQICIPVSRHGLEGGEGISIDNSFSQHNPMNGRYSQIYAGTYGGVYLTSIFKFVSVLCGGLSLNTLSLRYVEKFITDGMGWFFYSGVYDFHVCGRGVSRGMESAASLGAWSQILLDNNPANPEALDELIQRAAGNESSNKYYRGGQVYWVNDYLCHFYDGFSFWNKTVSTRSVGSESGNGENLKGYYIGCGSYLVSGTGMEYHNIQPIWDWQRIPGTTVEQDPNFNYPLIEWGDGAWGSHDYAGVMGDNKIGLSSMILSRGNVKGAKKTTIALENSLLFLGTSIDTTSANYSVVTSVNQCFRMGDIKVVYSNGCEMLLLSGRHSSSDISEVVHGDLRYIFQLSDNQVVTVEASVRSGSWRDINKDKTDEEIQGEVFSLWIEHQKGLDEQYCYEIRPVRSEVVVDRSEVINRHDCQLFAHKTGEYAVGAVFTPTDNWFQLRDVRFKLITPLAFVARNTSEGTLELTLSDLTQKLVEAEIFLEWAGVSYSKKLALPTDDNFKGQSISYVLTINDI